MPVKIAESSLPQAMKFVYDTFIPDEYKDIIDYRPKNSKDTEYLRDRKVTGLLYLKKFPLAKQAWSLVEFDENFARDEDGTIRKETAKYGKHAIYKNNVVLRTKEEFEKYFNVSLTNYNWQPDTVVYVRSDKQIEDNKFPNRDLQESAPYFYMYIDHSQVNLDVMLQRMYRMNEILENNPNAFHSGHYFDQKIKNVASVKKLL